MPWWWLRGRRMKMSRERGWESSSCRCTLTAPSSMLPRSGSGLHSPRYSSRIQRSTGLALAPTGSAFAAESSAQNGLSADDTDHLPGRYSGAGLDGEVAHCAVAMGGDL